MCTDSSFLPLHCSTVYLLANIIIYTDGITDCLTLCPLGDPLCMRVCTLDTDGYLHHMKRVSPSLSTQPAAGISPVHAAADGAVPNSGEGSDGSAGEKAL